MHADLDKRGIPPRDEAVPTERQGLFRKFEVHRVDGSDQPGRKHYGCRYFVLDVDHDPYAAAALAAYAAACESTHPELARDLREKWGAPTATPDGWRPIETAPRDGTTFWAWDGFSCFVCFFNAGEWQDHASCSGRPWTKLWSPLPSPPLQQEGC